MIFEVSGERKLWCYSNLKQMDSLTLFLWLSVTYTFLYFLNAVRKRLSYSAKLPPGPSTLPIVGNLLQLGNNPHESLASLAKIHGPLMTVHLGTLTTIVVSTASMAQEILQKHDQIFSGRTVPDAIRISGHHEASMVWSPPSHHWRNLRKLCASQIFSTQRLNGSEKIRLQQLNNLVDYLHENANSRRAINIGQVVFSTTLNIISNVIFSIDLTSYSSESGQDFKAIVWGVLEEAGRPNLVDYFPFLRPFDPLSVRQRTAGYFRKLDKLFNTMIEKRLESSEEHMSDDLLSLLLHHRQENGSTLRRVDITSLLKDLFVAGTDTSAGTLEWAMAELLRNQDIMSKAKLELKENVNNKKLIEESDIARLPYLQAIVKETLRLHPPAPLLVPHRAETNVQVGGFDVPRHAQVLVNAWTIGRDPATWANPTSFIPERFLESNIDFRGRDFELIPFGAGRRICPGMPLAYRMVHLMLASLLHSFDWQLEDGLRPEDINMEAKFGLTLQKSKPLRAVPVLD